MNRDQKIALLRRRMNGEAIAPAELYIPNSPFIKSGAMYFNDGYNWTEEEFSELMHRVKRPSWLPDIWYIDVEDRHPGFPEWLLQNTKPISRRITSIVEDCSILFDKKLEEFACGSYVPGDEIYL